MGRQLFPGEHPLEGEVIDNANDIAYFLAQGGESRIYFIDASGVRIEVVSSMVATDVLLDIAKSVAYEPETDVP